MCELFAISSSVDVQINNLLKTFFSHSDKNPDGWGLAVFYGNSVSLEKEPACANRSQYLKARLRSKIEIHNMVAHIRRATRGNMDYENCHPFIMRDCDDRAWTLIHNGTIFDSPRLNRYVNIQTGMTDSERILYYIIDRVNARRVELGRALNLDERFALLDEIVCQIAPHNKINLIIYDGEVFYVHTNYKDTLFIRQEMNTAFFATTPLDDRLWLPLPFTTLLAYKDGRHILTGTCHGHEYIDDPSDTKFLYLDYLEC